MYPKGGRQQSPALSVYRGRGGGRKNLETAGEVW